MSGSVISRVILSGGQSQKIAMTVASAQSAALTCADATVTVDAACFMRIGTSASNPVALADGTDQYFPAGQYRIKPISGEAVPGGVGYPGRPPMKIAFIMASGTGNAYITPED